MKLRKWRCHSCGQEYLDPSPDGFWGPHRCIAEDNPHYQPDPSKPAYDPRLVLPIDNPRDETPWEDTGPDPDHPAAPRPSGIRAEGKGRSLVEEE